MSSFRDQLGEDWLRYQHHLDGVATTNNSTVCTNQPVSETLSNGPSSSTPCPPIDSSPPVLVPELPPAPLLSQETKDMDLETESTLQWLSHSSQQNKSTLEGSVVDGLAAGQEGAPHPSPGFQRSAIALSGNAKQEDEEGLGGKLSRNPG